MIGDKSRLEGQLRGLDFSVAFELPTAESAHGLEHPESTRRATTNNNVDQRLADERFEPIRRLQPVESEQTSSRVQRDGTCAHRERSQSLLLLGTEKVVRPGDCRLETLLARVAPAQADEQPEPLVEVRQDLCGRQGSDARRREFDREREPVESGDDRGDRGELGVVEVQGVVHGERPLDEQLHRRRGA